MAEIKNVYQKMAKVQYEFSLLPIKKSGYNKGVRFNYFELSDITPPLLKLCYENGLYINTKVDRNDDNTFYGEMTVVNADNPQEKVMTSCSLRAPQINASATQQDGAVITYARRYLLMLMFNIVEPDLLDAQDGNETSNATNPPKPRVNKNDSKPMLPPPSSVWGELMRFFGWTGNNPELDNDALDRSHDVLQGMGINIKTANDLTQDNADEIRKWMETNPSFRHLAGPEEFVGDDVNDMETRK